MAMRALVLALLVAAAGAVNETEAADFHRQSFAPRRRPRPAAATALLAANIDLKQKSVCEQPMALVSLDNSSWAVPVQGESPGHTVDLRAEPNFDHALLVARYDEHLDWLVRLLDRWQWIQNVIIINKGTPILAPLPMSRVRIRQINNVGREGETLLHYLIQEYDRLPRRLWFLQGEPLTHAPHVEALFDPEIVRKYNPLFQPLTKQFAEYARIPDRLLVNEDHELDDMVTQLYVSARNGGIVFSNGLNEDDPLAKAQGVYGFSNILDAMQEEHKVQDRAETVRSICQYLNISVPDSRDELIPYTMSAMFYVSAEGMRRQSRSTYEGIRKWLIYDDATGNHRLQASPGGAGVDTCQYLRQGGRRGYLLERLWQWMFTGSEHMPPTNRGMAQGDSGVAWPPDRPFS